MACSVLAVFNGMLARHNLEVFYAPIQLVLTHPFERFSGVCHILMVSRAVPTSSKISAIAELPRNPQNLNRIPHILLVGQVFYRLNRK